MCLSVSAGESYAGVYIPMLAARYSSTVCSEVKCIVVGAVALFCSCWDGARRVSKGNAAGESSMNLKGIMVSNGSTMFISTPC